MSEKTGLPARDAARMPDNGELVKVLSKVLELERERVAVSTRQAENSAAAIRGVDADNERQYQFHRNRFERQQDHREERHPWRGVAPLASQLASPGTSLAVLSTMLYNM